MRLRERDRQREGERDGGRERKRERKAFSEQTVSLIQLGWGLGRLSCFMYLIYHWLFLESHPLFLHTEREFNLFPCAFQSSPQMHLSALHAEPPYLPILEGWRGYGWRETKVEWPEEEELSTCILISICMVPLGKVCVSVSVCVKGGSVLGDISGSKCFHRPLQELDNKWKRT